MVKCSAGFRACQDHVKTRTRGCFGELARAGNQWGGARLDLHGPFHKRAANLTTHHIQADPIVIMSFDD